jgi:3-hydroxyisobutyrate dehydrogenase-like beta-hydroxyacid dehydrogenase
MTGSQSSRIALIGLGRMGTAVAGRLVAGGWTVVGHDRRPEARAAAVAAGARWAANGRRGGVRRRDGDHACAGGG